MPRRPRPAADLTDTTQRLRTDRGFVPKKYLPVGPTGRPLCRNCGQECPPPKRSFCSESCVHAWKILSDPNYVRDQVFQRDFGVCAVCGVDTRRILAISQTLDPELRVIGTNPNGSALWSSERRRYLESLGFDPKRKSLWDADHIVEVVKGGGLCGLDNYQTLCHKCHREKTVALNRERAAARRAARQKAAEGGQA